jgi:SET domain-containing protein
LHGYFQAVFCRDVQPDPHNRRGYALPRHEGTEEVDRSRAFHTKDCTKKAKDYARKRIFSSIPKFS